MLLFPVVRHASQPKRENITPNASKKPNRNKEASFFLNKIEETPPPDRKLSMSEHSDILGGLSNEQLQEGIRMLNEQIRQAHEDNRTADAIVYITSRNAIHHELEVRASQEEGAPPARPTFSMTVTSHHVLRIMEVCHPEFNQEELARHFEYDIRTMSNERAQSPWYSGESSTWPERVPYVPLHSSKWPKMRPIAPLVIIHPENQEGMFTNAAPPLNAWWAAEDRIKTEPVGTWELVWREHYNDTIHEGWIQRVTENTEGDFLHYLTRYKDSEPSPLPLQ